MSSEQDYVEETGLPEEENYNTAGNNDSNSDRRGHVCCGKLMDTRKGVLAVDTINIFGILFSLLLNSVIYHERSFGGVLAGLLGTLLSVIGVFGALKFDIRASGIATLGFSFCLLMDKPSYTKEDFDMKQMKDVKNMLINKMGNLMGNKDDKEDFKPYDKENEKLYLNKMKTSCGSPIQIN